jgi:enamine deaminase RidA (YjgF/YER057c/UK114 family)
MEMKFIQNAAKLAAGVAAAGLIVLSGCDQNAAQRTVAPVKHNQTKDVIISKSVMVPAGYDTFYFSGLTAGRPADGEQPGDTEAQATKVLETMKANLAEEGLTFGNVVKMNAFLAPDPNTSILDRDGWTRAYNKYFGTEDQPNKPARSTIPTNFGNTTLIEIEVIAVRPQKQ